MQANKIACPALQCQTDEGEKLIKPSIPQPISPKHMSIEMEPEGMHGKLLMDGFVGNVRSFKLYLKAMRIRLVTGYLVP